MNMEAFDFEDNGTDQSAKLDFSRYLYALKRRWWLALLIAIAVSIPWAFYVKQEKPVYESTVSIRFRDLKGNPKVIMQDIYEQLTSRRFAEQSVRDLGLVASIINDSKDVFYARDEIFSSFTSTTDPAPGKYVLRVPGDGTFSVAIIDPDSEEEVTIFTDDVTNAIIDTVSLNGFSFTLADPERMPRSIKFEIIPFRTAANSLQDRISIDLNSSWTLMFLKMQDSDPFVVMQTANSLAERFVKVSIATDVGAETTQLHTLKARLERAKEDYMAIDRRLTAAKSTTGMEGGLEIYQSKISQRDAAQRRLDTTIEQRDGLKQLIQRLTAVAPGSDETETSGSNNKRYIYNAIANYKVFDNDPTMAVNRQRLGDLDSRLSKEIMLKTAQHPDIVDLRQQIDELYDQVLETANAKVTDLNREIGRRENEVKALHAEIQRIPVQQSHVEELAHEWKQKSDYYQELRAQYQDLEISTDVEKSAIEILDQAIKPEHPINGNKKAKAATGGLVGLFLGIGVVMMLELLDKTLKTVDDVRNSLKYRMLGSIPQIDFGEHFEFQDHEKAKMVDQQLVTHDYAPTPIGEAYRSLRTNILFSKSVGRVQTLVLTSMAPGDGKSFTAGNLSITMAQQKSNTLLVDTDLRRGVLHNTFGLPKEPGFSNFLTGAALPSEIISETHIPNLSLISCGSLIPNPSEMLGSVQLRRFIDEMRRRYDLIIFDTPPLNAATDAVVLGTQVDGVVIVLRASKTKKDVARQKMELFDNVQAKVLGLILNGTRVDLAHEGYSYYHY